MLLSRHIDSSFCGQIIKSSFQVGILHYQLNHLVWYTIHFFVFYFFLFVSSLGLLFFCVSPLVFQQGKRRKTRGETQENKGRNTGKQGEKITTKLVKVLYTIT